MSEDLLYEKIYQKTQDCGRTQFVNLLQQNQIKIEELQKENEDLKNKQNKFEKDYKEMIEIQGQNGNYNYDSYMLGLYNGMEYIIALYENREPIYRSGKDVNFLHENNILTEFEKWLEETEKRKNARLEQFSKQKNRQELVLERLNAQIVFIDCCLKRIQELKEGKK